jgi:hypothetical protein
LTRQIDGLGARVSQFKARCGDNPPHRAKSASPQTSPYNHAFVNRAARAYAFLAFLESKPEILVTSSSNASVSAPRKSLTIIQTLVIVGAAGLIASLLVKLLV